MTASHRSTGRAGRSTAIKRRPRPLQLQTYAIVTRAVEKGVAYGLQRYLKYNSSDINIDIVSEHLERDVLNALGEVIQFDKERA